MFLQIKMLWLPKFIFSVDFEKHFETQSWADIPFVLDLSSTTPGKLKLLKEYSSKEQWKTIHKREKENLSL